MKKILLTVFLAFSFISCREENAKEMLVFKTTFQRCHIGMPSACFENEEKFIIPICIGECTNFIKGSQVTISKETFLTEAPFWYMVPEVAFFGGYKNGKMSGMFTIPYDGTISEARCFDDYFFEGEEL